MRRQITEPEEHLVSACLVHLSEQRLPHPFPKTEEEYSRWSDASDLGSAVGLNGWFQLYDLAIGDPESAWVIILELLERSTSSDWPTLAAGPFGTFLAHHSRDYADEIATELTDNPAFREMYRWTRHADSNESFRI